MENNTIVLKRITKGSLGMAIVSILGAVIVSVVAYVFMQWASSGLKTPDRIMTGEIIFWTLIVMAAGILLDLLNELIYGPTQKMIFYLDKNGKIEKIHRESVGFIYAKEIDEKTCNRILGVKIRQSTIGNFNNTGSMTINFVSFANASIENQEWDIKGIEGPVSLKKKILEASPVHEGLGIKK